MSQKELQEAMKEATVRLNRCRACLDKLAQRRDRRSRELVEMDMMINSRRNSRFSSVDSTSFTQSAADPEVARLESERSKLANALEADKKSFEEIDILLVGSKKLIDSIQTGGIELVLRDSLVRLMDLLKRVHLHLGREQSSKPDLTWANLIQQAKDATRSATSVQKRAEQALGPPKSES